MSPSNNDSAIQNSQKSITKLQKLFQNFSDCTPSDYLDKAAIQNFILSFQELDAKEVDSITETKGILSQIELDFLDDLRQKKGNSLQKTNPLSQKEVIERNKVHKDKLALLREEVKNKIEKYSNEISTEAPYKDNTIEGIETFGNTFKAQEIYQYSSNGIKQLTKDLIEESKKDLKNIGIILRPEIKYVINCFGSLARNEASPYSDLEFGVLLEDGIEEKIGKEALEAVKEYFRDLTDLLNVKVINLGETTARIQDIEGVKELGISEIPIKNGFSFDSNVLGGCKTPLGNKRATIKKIAEINQDDELRTEKISKLKENEYELIMTSSQMAQFHNEDWYQKDRHLSTVLYTSDILDSSSLGGEKEIVEKYQEETNKILDRALKNDELSQEENAVVQTLRMRRALALLRESAGRFEPKAGRDQERGKSFSPKYDFYRPATMVIDHLSYLYNIGNKDGEKSVWERFETLFVETSTNTPRLPLSRIDHSNIEGINNLRWMIDRTLQIRLQNYMAKENQNEDMILLDNIENQEERDELKKQGLGIAKQDVFEVYYVMISFFNDINSFNESQNKNTEVFRTKFYCDDGLFRQALIHNLFSDYRSAIDCHEKFIKNCQTNEASEYQNLAASLDSLGANYATIGEHRKAADSYEKAVNITKKYDGLKQNLAASLHNLGCAYGEIQEYKKQQNSLIESLEIITKLCGRENIKVATILNSLGTSYRLDKEYQKEIKVLKQALEISQKILGDKNELVATILHNLGEAYGYNGELEEKQYFLEESLKIKKEIFGSDHYFVADSLVGMGNYYGERQDRTLEDVKTQIKLLNQALEIYKKFFGETHPKIANILYNLGHAYEAYGTFVKADDKIIYHHVKVYLLIPSLEIQTKIEGQYHKNILLVLYNLAESCEVLGYLTLKIKLQNQALEIEKNIFGENDQKIVQSLNNLGITYTQVGDFEESRKCYENALKITETFCTEGEAIELLKRNLQSVQIKIECSERLDEAVQHHVKALEKKDSTNFSILLEKARESFINIIEEKDPPSLLLYTNLLYQQKEYDVVSSFLKKMSKANTAEKKFFIDQRNIIILPEELQRLMDKAFKENDKVSLEVQHLSSFLSSDIQKNKDEKKKVLSKIDHHVSKQCNFSKHRQIIEEKIDNIFNDIPSPSISISNTKDITPIYHAHQDTKSL